MKRQDRSAGPLKVVMFVIYSETKVMTKCEDSTRFKAKVVKLLSQKDISLGLLNDEALFKKASKKFFGNHDVSKAIKKRDVFLLDDETDGQIEFSTYYIDAAHMNVVHNINGSFSFMNTDDLLKLTTIYVKGETCMVPRAYKIALTKIATAA